VAEKSALHLVWDWNGTVLNDFEVSFRSTNSSLRDAGLPGSRRRRTARSSGLRSAVFYAAVLDRDPSDEECDFLDRAFHAYYLLYEREAAPSSGLPHLFRQWHGAGHPQSLLSLFPHRKLVPAVERHGLTSYFALVQGATPPYAEQKDLADHLARLNVDPASAVLIGDMVDDARAAEQAGVKVVLYSGGFGARADLAATGAPVATR